MLKLSESAVEQIACDIVDWLKGQGKSLYITPKEGGGSNENEVLKAKQHQYWLDFMQRVIKNEVALRKSMVKYFKEQGVKALRALGGSKAISKDVKKVEGVPTSKSELKKLAEYTVPPITATVISEGRKILAELNVGISFDVLNPEVIKYIETRTGDLIKSISNTTKEALRRTLKEGVELGESIPKLAKRIASVYDDAQGYRSVLIARTETLSASNNGALNAYRQSGICEKKTWLTAGDARVREEHAAIDGETVLLNEAFSNGLMVPSEPNCRCSILPVLFKE